MNTPPAVGNSPLRSEAELPRPVVTVRLKLVISFVETREDGRPGAVRLLVRLAPRWCGWEEELAAAAKANVDAEGPQAMERILDMLRMTAL